MEIYCGRGAVFMAGSNYSLVESPASKLSSTIHTTGLAGSPEEPLNLFGSSKEGDKALDVNFMGEDLPNPAAIRRLGVLQCDRHVAG